MLLVVEAMSRVQVSRLACHARASQSDSESFEIRTSARAAPLISYQYPSFELPNGTQNFLFMPRKLLQRERLSIKCGHQTRSLHVYKIMCRSCLQTSLQEWCWIPPCHQMSLCVGSLCCIQVVITPFVGSDTTCRA